ncbi:MAG: response regulator transcription factor [Lachnospiraceae bacterium]|nr:response regulator transcription factor [Lachnospiraceae bacterium]
MNKDGILVVEDDNAIRNLIMTTLETQKYAYRIAQNAAQALIEVTTHQPDMLLLDLGLPDMDGIEVIKKIRSWSTISIIVITARSEEQDKIDALDAGADDYLTKPFSITELLARIRGFYRRISYLNRENITEEIFENGELSIHYASQSVFMGKTEIHLTPTEYKTLCILAKNVGRVLTHAYITKNIWGSSFESDISSLRVHVATLRKKIENAHQGECCIKTHIGVGYCMIK